MPTNSNFQQIVDAYILETQSLGFKFTKAAQVLQRIISLQMRFDQNEPLLSRKTVEI